MLSLALCAVAFIVTWIAARRSLVGGVVALLAVGYSYGIVRANVIQTFSHFTFDASLAALYFVHLPRIWQGRAQPALQTLRPWFLFLIGWPLVLTLIPVQDYLVQLVGFRGNVFFLPMLLIGASLDADEFRRIALWLAVFNAAAFGVALAEFYIGIEPFFPVSAVTEIMYQSRDVGGAQAYRIPATFSSAHAFAGTMVATIPLLFGTFADAGRYRGWRLFLAASLVLTGVGVFMAAARLPVIVLAVVLLVGILRSGASLQSRIGGILFVSVLAIVSMQSDRLQRFRTLQDTEVVAGRVQVSVNASFFDLAVQAPLGNGIGGGGTSMPYFLAHRLRDPKVIENEYARVMMEQGIVGLLGWLWFLAMLLARGASCRPSGLVAGQRMALAFVLMSCISGVIGLGMLTSIPQSAIFAMLGGWMLRDARPRAMAVPAQRGTGVAATHAA